MAPCSMFSVIFAFLFLHCTVKLTIVLIRASHAALVTEDDAFYRLTMVCLPDICERYVSAIIRTGLLSH